MPDFDTLILIKGIAIGFVIAAPVGPAGFLCIERTLNHGKISGLVSALGASMADAFYGAIAAFGLIHLSQFLIGHQSIFRGIGGIFLLYLGITYLFKKPNPPKKFEVRTETKSEMLKDFVSTFFLTITNPLTLISFATLFAGTGFQSEYHGWWQATLLTIAVFIGAMLCWSLLLLTVSWLESHVENFSLKSINKIAGVVMLGFGVVMILTI